VLPVLLVAFVCVPLAELWVLWQVGDALGILPTLGVLLADSVLGGVLMRTQGRGAWRRFNTAVASGRPPAREVVDGALIILGGALLLTPGFLTDALGLALLAPPTRAVVRRALVRRAGRRLVVSAFARGAAGPARGARGSDVDGTASELQGPRRAP
jgi:UPF0716 protein FxsA